MGCLTNTGLCRVDVTFPLGNCYSLMLDQNLTFTCHTACPMLGHSMMIFYKIKPAKAVRGPIFSQLIGLVVEGHPWHLGSAYHQHMYND